ncbi:MAG: hypothetical protein AAGL90_05640 [Pseudomonadota bacterium]
MSQFTVANASLIEMGPGARIALYGFRACMFGQAKCCCLLKMFHNTFGETGGGPALGLIMKLADRLGNKGQRRLEVSVPDAVDITHDEASLLSALAAAQDEDMTRARAHLTWLLARRPSEYEETLVFDLVDYCSVRGLELNTPERGAQLSSIRLAKSGAAPALALVGRA